MSEIPHYPRVFARIFNKPHLIDTEELKAIVFGLSDRFEIKITGLDPPDERMKTMSLGGERPKPYQVVDGVGVIPVMGTLVHRSGWMDAMSGLTSYESIQRAFDAAMSDPEVSSVLLHIDSPGGEASGVFDLADHILAANGTKPIVAFGDGGMMSAAYMLASAADQVFISQSTLAGSIGVRTLHVDQSKMDAERGLVVTEIFAGARKLDGTPHAPLSTEGMQEIQGRVNDLYDIFVNKVAQNRGLSTAQIRGTEAGVFTGQKAVSQGLADGVRTLQDVLATQTLRDGLAQLSQLDRRSEEMEKCDTTAALAAAYPDLTKQLTTEAVATERGRIKKILTLAPHGQEALAQRLAFDTDTAPGDAAEQFLGAQQAIRTAQLKDFTSDAPAPVDPVLADTTTTPDHIATAQAVNAWRQKRLSSVK